MALRLEGQLSLDGSGWQRGLAQAGTAAKSFADNSLGGLKGQIAAAFSVGAIVGLAKKTAEYADSVDELASRIGVSTGALQEWSFAAKQNGADAERLVRFIEKLNDLAANPANLSAFAKLGINPEGMTSEGLFRSVASQTQGKSGVEIQSILRSLGFDLKNIGPIVNLLASDLNEAGASARKMGAVMDEAMLQQLAKLNDQLSILGQITATQLGPAFIAVARMALEAQSKLAGAAQWWGSTTAGITKEDILRVAGHAALLMNPTTAGMGAKGLYNDITAPNSEFQNQFNRDADNALNVQEKAMNELLKKLDTVTPRPESTITVGGATTQTPTARINRASIPSDSLTSVGNFLGAGGNTIQSIAQKQLTLAQMNLAVNKEMKKIFGDVYDLLKNQKPAIGFPFN